MRRHAPSSMAVFAAALLCCAPPAPATQHLVRAGDEWSDLEERIKPGDEVILMPGRHRSATLDNLRGLPDRPIIIRSLDAVQPTVIEADSYGIKLRRPKWVQISDIIIEGAKIHGVMVDGASSDAVELLPGAVAEPGGDAEGEDESPAAVAKEGLDEPSGWITLNNVTVRHTGPRGQRHAIHLHRVNEVQVKGCIIEGWGGSGIEVAGCTHVRIEGCVLRGKDDHYQVSGVRTRAGSSGVLVLDCSLLDCGDQAVCLGGAFEPEDFSAEKGPGHDAAAPGYAADRVRVERCLMRGGQCAVAYVNCNQTTVRACTIVRPRHAVVSVRNEQSGGDCSAVAESVMVSNLIVWEPGDVQTLMHLANADPAGLELEENLWWSPDLAESLERIGPMPGTVSFPQVTEVDPKLDGNFRPTVVKAELFGVFAP